MSEKNARQKVSQMVDEGDGEARTLRNGETAQTETHGSFGTGSHTTRMKGDSPYGIHAEVFGIRPEPPT